MKRKEDEKDRGWKRIKVVEGREMMSCSTKKAAPPKNCSPPPLDMPQLPAACWAARHSTVYVVATYLHLTYLQRAHHISIQFYLSNSPFPILYSPAYS